MEVNKKMECLQQKKITRLKNLTMFFFFFVGHKFSSNPERLKIVHYLIHDMFILPEKRNLGIMAHSD